MAKKLTMGQYLAAQLEGLGKVTKVGYSAFFNTSGLAEAALGLDRIMADKIAFAEDPSKLEKIGLEILFALAGYKDAADFMAKYQAYATRAEEI